MNHCRFRAICICFFGMIAAGCWLWDRANAADPPMPSPPASAYDKPAEGEGAAQPSVPATTESTSPAESANQTESPTSARTSFLRPPMTDQQRHDWATRLRAVYSQPPARWPPPLVDRGVEWTELGLLPTSPAPEKSSAEAVKITLGKMLFFDPRLSGSGQMACATCHDPELAWTDGRSTGIGNHRKLLPRNVPSIMNVAFRKSLFWDGRAATLEEQVVDVLHNPDEMQSSDEDVLERIQKPAGYRDQFRQAFGDEKVTVDRAAEAIAAFERTVVSGHSRFDAFLKGSHDVLSDEAVIGLHLFRTDAHCMNCHYSPTFSDEKFHDVGLSYYGRTLEDLGRYKITSAAENVGEFKTPGLRNVANTAPYMHNGLFQLDGVLNMYNVGMPTLRRKPGQQNDPLFPTKSPLLHPLYFNRQDLGALKEFLESLSEPTLRIRPPALPEDPPEKHDEAVPPASCKEVPTPDSANTKSE